VLAVVALATCLTATRAAGQDAFGNGDGRHGAFTAPPGVSSINIYTTVARDAVAGATLVTVADATGFTGDDLIMLWRPAGYPERPDPDSRQLPIDLSLSDTGRYELARILHVSSNELTLTTVLQHGFAAHLTQVIRVPEYTTVDVPAGATLMPGQSWAGSRGGIIAFMATGAVTVDGRISADASGFRGGALGTHVSGDESAFPLNVVFEAPAGEGIHSPIGLEAIGANNVANGGGGTALAIVFNTLPYWTEGGGGGHGGAAPWRVSALPNGTLGHSTPGVRVSYSMVDRMTFGGGGGGSHVFAGARLGQPDRSTAGGAGGGVVFVRAASLAGNGAVTANGANTLGNGSGAGAGGGIHMWLTGTSTLCAGLQARGGNMLGDVHGSPGGGGHVLLRTTSACAPGVAGDVFFPNTGYTFPNGVRTSAGVAAGDFFLPNTATQVPIEPGIVELIALPNPVPAVNAGPDQGLYVCTGCLAPYTLIGAASDLDNERLQFQWVKNGESAPVIEGVVGESPMITTVYLLAGTHTFQLRITDPFRVVTDTVVVDVRSADIGTLFDQLNDANGTIATLTSELAAANETIASLTKQLTSANLTISASNAQIASLQLMLRNALGDPTFTIPGATLPEQMQNLITAINGLNPGQKLALYRNLGGSKNK
jgi:hypothetical protein